MADLAEKQTHLLQQINQWREVQIAHMSAISSIIASSPSPETIPLFLPSSPSPETIPLFLPSSLAPNTPGLSQALEKEIRLRIAQANDALADIRHHLRLIAGLWQFKKLSVAGTGNQPNTRMQSFFNRLNHCKEQCVLWYRAAYSALLAADPQGSWGAQIQELKDSDVRGPGRDGGLTSNSQFVISWIWLVPWKQKEVEANSSEESLDEGL